MLLSIFMLMLSVTLVEGVHLGEDIDLQEVEDGVLFEGDMVVSKEDADLFINKGGILNDTAYGLIKRERYKWPGAIVPYVLHKSVKNPVLNKMGLKGPTEIVIGKAMKRWEQKTCIRFVKRTTERDYVEFFDGGYGKCYSSVGRRYGKQRISLGFGCFTTGIAIHEIGHSLGLYHEQSRPDRDDYIEILWDNISEKAKHNCKKYDRYRIDSRGSPYDYDSIMHYEWNAFGKIPLVMRTIRAKKPGVSFGQRNHISKEDAWQINTFYGCKV